MSYILSDLDMPFGSKESRPVAVEISGDTPFLQWPAQMLEALQREVGDRSVILIRNSGVHKAADFAMACERIYPELAVYETGEHPAVKASAGIYEPVLFSPADRLLWHHENSFNWQWPRIVAFACVTPARSGGETTLVDSERVFALAPNSLVRKLQAKGIRYSRFCDGYAGRSWQEVYLTENWDVALLRAQERQETLQQGEDGAWIESVRPAFLGSPSQQVWFNQLLHWHVQALPEEIRILTEQGRIPRYRDCSYGDGTPIEPAYVDEIIRLHDTLEWPVRWNAGDLLFIRNDLVSHGRNPYVGTRHHFARFAGMGEYPLQPRLDN